MGANIWPVNAVAGAPQYSGRMLRQTTVAPFTAMGSSARPLGAKSGIRVGTPSSIVSVTSTTWTVQPFAGIIDGESSAIAGPYGYAFDTAQTGTVTAAGSDARKDRLDVQVSDPAESDGTSTPTVKIIYTQGAATGGAVPAAPARSHALCVINVPATGGGSPTISWAPEWSGDPGEWTFNTLAELTAYTTLITAANVPVNQRATVLADSSDYFWSGAWRRSGSNLIVPTSASGATVNADGSVSFSAVSAFAVDGVFATGAFDKYVIELDQTTTTVNTNLNYQERAGGADNTSTYFWDIIFSASNAVAAANTANTGSIQLTAQTALYRHTTIQVFNPAVPTIRTLVISDDASTDTSTAGQSRATGWHGTAAAFDGFKISTTVGAITGKLRIYGISNG